MTRDSYLGALYQVFMPLEEDEFVVLASSAREWLRLNLLRSPFPLPLVSTMKKLHTSEEIKYSQYEETYILIGSNEYVLMWFIVLLFHGTFKHCVHTSFPSQNILCTHDMCLTLNSGLLTLK